MNKILILDPSKSVRKSLCETIALEGYSPIAVDSIEDAEKRAIEAIAQRRKLKLLITNSAQLNIPPSLSNTPRIVISDTPSLDEAVNCIKCGAADYLTRPINVGRLLNSIREVIQKQEGQSQSPTPTRKSRPLKRATSATMVGDSAQIESLRQLIHKVAPSDARVMILGENGTGKELVARSIHQMSSRSSAPFIEVNCAAIPSELIESELFGHEKGAFTSAVKMRIGKFEQANGGTLFLDEIGDMSLAAQAKVLRALQERKICRVGSDKDIDVDVRVLAATNKNIVREIELGNFREDLYHRIGVIVIRVASLRERNEDIPSLVRHFLCEICDEYKIDCKEISDEAMQQLKSLKWSGNIRELRNVVERLVVLSEHRIEARDVTLYCC